MQSTGSIRRHEERFVFIHDGISLIPFVIPGFTKPAPYLIRGNPVLFWIPAPRFREDKLRGNDVVCCD